MRAGIASAAGRRCGAWNTATPPGPQTTPSMVNDWDASFAAAPAMRHSGRSSPGPRRAKKRASGLAPRAMRREPSRLISCTRSGPTRPRAQGGPPADRLRRVRPDPTYRTHGRSAGSKRNSLGAKMRPKSMYDLTDCE
jgi:hypothetical protein